MPGIILEELRRVLRPNGRMVIVVTRARAVGKGLQLAWRIRSLSVHRMREAGLALVHEESLPDSWWDARRGQNA